MNAILFILKKYFTYRNIAPLLLTQNLLQIVFADALFRSMLTTQ